MLTTILAVISLIVLSVALILGFNRNFKQSVARSVAFAAALALAYFITDSVLKALSIDTFLKVSELSDTLREYLASDSPVVEMLLSFLSSISAPILFFIFFMIFSALSFVIYFIISQTLLCNRHLQKKGKSTVTPGSMRLIDVVLHLAMGVIFLSILFLPLSSYAPALTSASKLLTDTNETETDKVSETVANIASGIEDNFILNACSSVTSPFIKPLCVITYDTDKQTDALSVIDTLADLIPTALDITNEPSADEFYKLADRVEKDGFVDRLLGKLLSEAGSNWKEGKLFLSLEPLALGDDALNAKIYETLADGDTANVLLRAVGNLLSVNEVFNDDTEYSGTDEEITAAKKEKAKQAFKLLAGNMTKQSVELTKGFFNSELLISFGISSEDADTYSEMLGTVFDELLELKEKEDKEKAAGNESGSTSAESGSAATDPEAKSKVDLECEAIAELYALISDPKTPTADALVEAIIKSEIIAKLLDQLTKTATVSDPMHIANRIDDASYNALLDVLAKNNVDSSSSLYKNLIAFIGR